MATTKAVRQTRLVRADCLERDPPIHSLELTAPPSMILVMGVTGAGKSHLVNTLLGREEVEVGQTLEPCTQNCRIICAKFGGCNTAIVDTPGFDDPHRSDEEILLEISQCLAAQHQWGVKLKGIIYVHRITDQRFQQSDVKSLKILELICGHNALSNVALVTNMWHNIDRFAGQKRKEELCRGFWAPLIGKGAAVHGFDGTEASARYIIGQLLGKREMVLQIHEELLDEDMSLGDTKAGAYISSQSTTTPSGNEAVFRRKVGLEAREKKEEETKRGTGFLKGFLGILSCLVGLGNLFFHIGVIA